LRVAAAPPAGDAGRIARIGIDIGGTFTDVVVALDDGRLVRDKALTTPGDYTDGILEALGRAAAQTGLEVGPLLSETDTLVNGTTVVTNAIAQLRGRRVGLLTTRGFRQQMRIHRGMRQVQLDLQKDLPPPEIVELGAVAEVNERIDRQGRVLVPIDNAQVRAAVARLVERERIDALAICFLWSFRYPDHERAAGEVVRQHFPELFVTLSSEIYPRIREYERMNTAVLNSFVSEGAETYIDRLRDRLGELGLAAGRISFMQSLGGQLSAEESLREPIRLTHSGPVGGVTAAAYLASSLGIADAITADMGGTSFDTALIKDGRPAFAHRTRINRLLTGLSTVDIHAIGAGGGSIAWIDERGIPQLGPHSAGADPGPACYGRGGTEPTLTDVSLVLGLIDAHNFWGGELVLDTDAATHALDALAGRLQRGAEETAKGLRTIAINNMATAMATVSLARGYDPRDFTVIGYGGASGLFLAEVCVQLGVPRLVMPRLAATFSAFGLLFADAVRSYAVTAEWPVATGSVEELDALYSDLERRAVGALTAQGFRDEEIAVEREADLKWVGQSFEVSMPIARDGLVLAGRDAIARGFTETYERLYGGGTAWHGFPLELHTARVLATAKTAKPELPALEQVPPRDASAARLGERRVALLDRAVPVYDGKKLESGMAIAGPALIDDTDTTIYLPPAARLSIDGWRNYVFELPKTGAP
jgi:N-methylhydantoinase A